MYEYFIKDYINKLTIKEIKEYTFKNNINLNKKELELVLNLIKKEWLNVYRGDENAFKILEKGINIEAYNKIYSLYKEYKIKYKK